MTIDDLRRELLGTLPLPVRPRCEHRYEGQRCSRLAEHECETGGGVRPQYVCGFCLQYQVASLGLIVVEEIPPARIDCEGKILPDRVGSGFRRRRSGSGSRERT